MDWNILLPNLASVLTIVASTGGMLYKLTLKPLNREIERMGQILDKIDIRLQEHEDKLNNIDVRMARVEESTKSAHKRINRLEQMK